MNKYRQNGQRTEQSDRGHDREFHSLMFGEPGQGDYFDELSS